MPVLLGLWVEWGVNVVFIVYRRPELTRRVFERIAAARPERLFVIADGPRDSDDEAMCAATREITENVTWPCDVRRDYATENQGSRTRISGGLDWVFSQVEEAIILEDDCLPDPTFFRFCSELLERYRHDDRVGQIAGSSFVRDACVPPESYYFSRYPMIWGWATWRRSWQELDIDMAHWPEVKAAGRHFLLFPTRREALYYEEIWDEVHAGRMDVWGLQWLFTRLIHGTVSVVPSVNLVSNLGFGVAATRTLDRNSPGAEFPLSSLEFPLNHPSVTIVNVEADRKLAYDFLLPEVRVRECLLNKHFYGSCLRKIPWLGAVWAQWRGQRWRRLAAASKESE